MNIVLISTTDYGGGAARAAITLHSALMKTGVSSYMMVKEKKSKEKNNFPVLADKSSFLCRCEDILLQKSNKDTLNFSMCFFSQSKVDMKLLQQADIIHLHWINGHFIHLSLLKKILSLGKPVVWTLHDMWPITGGCHYAYKCTKYKKNCLNCHFMHNFLKSWIPFFMFQIKKSLYKKYDVTFVGVSKWISDCAKTSGLLSNNKVLSIPLAIDIDFYKREPQRKLRSKLGIDERQFVITFGANSSTKDKRKGFAYLVKSLQILQQTNKELSRRVYILIFGDKRRAASFNISGFQAKNLGYLGAADMVDAYSASDVVIIPSLAENFPYVAVESLSCKTPVVAFNVGGLPEIISHKKRGYLANYKDASDLASGISWVAQNNPDNVLGENGRFFVEENCTYQVVTEKHLRLYQSLV